MEALWKYLLEEEGQYTKNLEAFRDVYINMIQRETVVPQAVQDELYPGFDRLLAGQVAFFASIRDTPPPVDLLAVYRRMAEQCEQGMMQYLGNVTRAVGVLLELTASNKTWQVYMEGAVLDAKAKGRDFHTFLVMPRAHLGKLMAIMCAFEGTRPTVRALEQLELKCRNVAGRAAVEEAKGRPGMPGLSKLKLPTPEFLERPTRRLVREGKLLAQAAGLGPGASKKKAKEVGYWMCDDCLMWGAVKGPVKSCVRFLQCQVSVERLDEGGFVVDVSDAGTGHSMGIVCADEASKTMWEADLSDWVTYAIDADRRARRDEAERIQFEAEERARQDAERLRLMEAERVAVAQRRAEEEKRAQERARQAEAERQERQRQEAEQARQAELQRQERQRQEAEQARQAELQRQERLDAERAAAVAAAAALPPPPPPAASPGRGSSQATLPPPAAARLPQLVSSGRASGQAPGPALLPPPPPPLVAPPPLERVATTPTMPRTNSGPTPSPQLVRSHSQGLMSQSMPAVPQLPVAGGRPVVPVASAIPSAARPSAPSVSPRSAAAPGAVAGVGAAAGRGLAQPVSMPNSPLTAKARPEVAQRRSDPVLEGFATPLPNSMLPATDAAGPRVPQARIEKPPPWAAATAAAGGSPGPSSPVPGAAGSSGGGWAMANPSANAAALAAAPASPAASSGAGPRLPQQRAEKPPPWETQPSAAGPNGGGPRLPQKRVEAPPPWETNK